MICVFNDDGSMSSDCGQFAGLMRFECRRLMLEKMKEIGCYRDTKPNPGQKLPLSQRTGDVIEPMLKPQWWVDSKDMATKAADAVRAPALVFIIDCCCLSNKSSVCAGAPGRYGNQARHFQRHLVRDALLPMHFCNSLRRYQWLDNIKDWCISRQLWWGHRIPAW
jgi:valyl-tRNA synthetase